MACTIGHIKCITALLLLSIHASTSNPAKTRPVIEVINEQARIDDGSKTRQSGFLPYGNPLAGNSKQNARLHAQNQQAMFLAERVRQHRAQLQRWTTAPQQEDSYMKAYHESQENHHLALEQQQSRDGKAVTIAPKLHNVPQVKRAPRPQKHEVSKITKVDAIKTDRSRSRTGIRNHRSYGSIIHLSQSLQPKPHKQQNTVYVSPGPTYDQGVTIKPNGNVGLASNTQAQESKLYTSAIPSTPPTTQYVYPKQYSQMQNYQSSYDIDTLNALLNKSPNEQFTEFNALINHETETKDNTLTTPIDLFFYLKDKPELYSQHFDHTKYAHIPNYANEYSHETKDHTPITEEVDDIEDPYKHKPKPYTAQSVPHVPEEYIETTTTKNNNYYKVEVASQTISAPHNPKALAYYKAKEAKNPTHQVVYYQPYESYGDDTKIESDHSERYLHHNAQHVGIQHLTEDGTGVSAYGDDNLHYASNYEFGYRVKDYHSGNDFGHHEAKEGEKTKGQYHVLLPDGRMQQVKYSAGPEGFHADISYDHLQKK
ncbi:hypothetical protein O0L34_g10286 [Tuta absoluta]|nr:hypothetical protein O0L34_g10286 [Tuta absoluta]